MKDNDWIPIILTSGLALIGRDPDVTTEEGFMRLIYRLPERLLVSV